MFPYSFRIESMGALMPEQRRARAFTQNIVENEDIKMLIKLPSIVHCTHWIARKYSQNVNIAAMKKNALCAHQPGIVRNSFVCIWPWTETEKHLYLISMRIICDCNWLLLWVQPQLQLTLRKYRKIDFIIRKLIELLFFSTF